MSQTNQILELITYLITIFGVPFAIYSYLREQKKQREEREYGTFDALDDKYIELQQLCLNYPNLDVFDTPYKNPITLSEAEQKQEEAIFLIRISIFERAFLMYQREDDYAKSCQWNGWDIEIKEWLNRENFKRIWDLNTAYFDQKFYNHYQEISKINAP